MNKKGRVVAALLLGIGLTSAMPGGGLPVATANDRKDMFPVEFATSASLDGQTRIAGYISNDSGDAVDHLELVITGLDAKGHVIALSSRTVDQRVRPGEQVPFTVQVPSSPDYRVEVERFGPQYPGTRALR